MGEYLLCDKCKAAGFKIPSACCPPQKEKILFWCDPVTEYTMIKNWGGEPWIFFKHQDGQWVSYRKATERDIQIACRKVREQAAAS